MPRNKKLFIRFFPVPKGERSVNRFLTEADPIYGFTSKPKGLVYEVGVSCYYAHEQDGGYIPYAVWAWGQPNPFCGMNWYCYASPADVEEAFLVGGEEVGKGQDGEPLIRNVKVISRLKRHKESDTYRKIRPQRKRR